MLKNLNPHDRARAAKLATWEKLLTAIEVAQMTAEEFGDAVLDGADYEFLLDRLADAWGAVVCQRPRMAGCPCRRGR